ncbi:MAG: glycosyltransferase [Rhizobiales bacterium]|nr:glycosyltransferase [Hyphomicrobiales bacterium]
MQIIPRLDTGGAELSAIEITDALTRAGAQALVVSEGGRLEQNVRDAGGELIRLAVATKNPWMLRRNASALTRLVADRGVALLHARSRAPAWSALWAARRAGVPLVTTYHGAYGENGPLKRLYNSVMARGDVVIANSNYTADLVRRRYGTERERITVIHRGVDLERFDPSAVDRARVTALARAWGLVGGERVILQAARLTGWKGHREVVSALGLLSKRGELAPDCVAIMAGDAQGRDSYRAEIERMIRDEGLEGRILLVGHCTDMPAAFALAHVAVVASNEPEAFGRAAVEAQAMGTPVISTNIGAPPETVRSGSTSSAEATGWLVPPLAPDRLATAILAALELDADERAAMGQRARVHVAARFSVRAMQVATLEVYDRLIASRLAAGFAAGIERSVGS